MKTCRSCQQELPLTAFHRRNDGHGDGHLNACADCENARRRIRYHSKRDAEQGRGRRKWQRLKMEILTHYGSACVCCGETEPVFLALDHINDDGNVHRKTIKAGNFYSWVKQNGFPSDFQILCHNCNWAKSHGGCPHKRNLLFPLPSFEVIGA